MLLDAILKLHDKILNMKLGVNRENQIDELERARLRRLPLAVGLGMPGRAEHSHTEHSHVEHSHFEHGEPR
jgi:hypothetical protein